MRNLLNVLDWHVTVLGKAHAKQACDCIHVRVHIELSLKECALCLCIVTVGMRLAKEGSAAC